MGVASLFANTYRRNWAWPGDDNSLQCFFTKTSLSLGVWSQGFAGETTVLLRNLDRKVEFYYRRSAGCDKNFRSG
jgi:hypothetical protein